MKVALVHDWLLTEGGAEKVFFEIWKLLPGKVHTLFYDKDKVSSFPFKEEDITPSFLQKVPFFKRFYRFLLPFFPLAIERLDLSYADLIISSSHCVAKGVLKKKGQLHICYCYTPVRYAWDLKERYLAPLGPFQRKVASLLLERIRRWDLKASDGVDAFIADSHFVAERIRKNYQREAKVIYPPVFIEQFFLSDKKKDYYVTHARLVPYKRIDLLIEAFNALPDKQLIVIGEGPEKKRLESLAKRNISFAGRVGSKELSTLLAEAKGYVFAAEEDFGIAVIEAQAAGLPVIALKKGASLETVLEGKTGLFFEEESSTSLIEAIKLFEKKADTFNPAFIRKWAEGFNLERFQKELLEFLQETKKGFYEDRDFSRRKREQVMASF